MENRTFGVEIEVMSEIGRRELALAISDAGVMCRETGYDHVVRPHWRIVTDASLGYSEGAEIVSPILRGEEGLREVAKVCDALKRAGCRVNSQTGLHVHIGVGDCSLQQIKNICLNFLNLEPMFDLILPESRRGNNNQYIRSNRCRYPYRFGGDYSDDGLMEAFERVRNARNFDDLFMAFQGGNRYHKMNLAPYPRQGTVEFRQHSGSVNGEKVCNWIRLLMAFTCHSIGGRPRPIRQTPARAFNLFFYRCKEAKPLRAYYVERWNELSGKRRKPVEQPPLPMSMPLMMAS